MRKYDAGMKSIPRRKHTITLVVASILILAKSSHAVETTTLQEIQMPIRKGQQIVGSFTLPAGSTVNTGGKVMPNGTVGVWYKSYWAYVQPDAISNLPEVRVKAAKEHEEEVKKNTPSPEEFDALKKLAEVNDPDAQIRMAMIYKNGWGVEKNDAMVIAWFERAAYLNDPQGEYNLGTILGKNPHTREEAVYWLSQASKSTDPWLKIKDIKSVQAKYNADYVLAHLPAPPITASGKGVVIGGFLSRFYTNTPAPSEGTNSTEEAANTNSSTPSTPADNPPKPWVMVEPKTPVIPKLANSEEAPKPQSEKDNSSAKSRDEVLDTKITANPDLLQKLDGTLANAQQAPDGSWLRAGEKIHISSIDTNENTEVVSYKGTNIPIPKYGLSQQSVAFFLQYNKPHAVEVEKKTPSFGNKDNVCDTNSTAPIIESGRQIALLTNTAGTLDKNILITEMKGYVRNPDYTMDGTIAGHQEVGPRTGTQQVKILKVEDDLATVVPTNKATLTFPAITVPVHLVDELKGLPHLNDKNLNWIPSSQIMAALEPVKQNYLRRSHVSTNGLNGPTTENSPLIPWFYSLYVDEYQKLKVPITTKLPAGDNSSSVAVANALNYLYTKANTNPTQISKSFLTWAHDAYELNDEDLSKPWNPTNQIKSEAMIEGERYRDYSEDKNPRYHSGPSEFHPERLGIALTSGQDHQIDLGRLLKAVHRFGVALENEQPSGGEWTLPTSEVQAAAKKRTAEKPIIVRCFSAWNEINLLTNTKDYADAASQYQIYRVLYYYFITSEVSKGHPVIMTWVTPIPGCNPSRKEKNNLYMKETFVLTGSGSPETHLSLQFLTPSGQFETYHAFGFSSGQILRGALDPGEVARAMENATGNIAPGRLISAEPFVITNEQGWEGGGVPASNLFVRKNIPNTKEFKEKILDKWGPYSGYTPKYEIYSLGFD